MERDPDALVREMANLAVDHINRTTAEPWAA
jgi:hypothetical protein